MDATITYVCSRRAAEKLVAQLAETYRAQPEYGPELMEEGFDDRQWTIVWEGGPEEWAYHASERIPAPAGTFLEPVNYCVLAIHRV
ncbi:hypothetical protein [Nonomuraea recticatena]|uniref:Uncharacterized protein n=1 Tax=Nonomuraea recticatena TaxID=46178 RepID=A0ABN3RPD8_9ACTN